MTTTTTGALSRRRFLYTGLAALGTAIVMPRYALAQTGPAIGTPTVLAFEGSALLAATAKGLHRHDGAGWSRLNEESPSALATHPGRPGVIFTGSREGHIQRSTDGGQSWTSAAAGLPGAAVLSLTIGARAPETLYAALEGDGLWRSEDDGANWELVMDRPYLEDAEHDVLSLVSVAHETGMGGIWLYAGTTAGLTRVPDCFCRWQDVVAGDALDALVAGKEPEEAASLPADAPVQILALAPETPETLYAALPTGLWRSSDAGVNWAQAHSEPLSALTVNPADALHLIAAHSGELRVSKDGGTTWTSFDPIKES